MKNSTGYNMRRLFTGSLGAFGIITAASFKLVPAPASEATLIAACATSQQAQASGAAASQLATRPAAIAALHPSSLPELARLGDYREDDALLAVRLPGEESAVTRAAAMLERALHDAGAEPLLTLDTHGTAAFWASVNDFPALRTGPREALVRVSTLPSEVMPALDLAQNLALQHDLTLRWLADLQAGALWLRLWAPDATLSASTPAFSNALRDILGGLARRWPHTILLASPDAYTSDIPVWGADPETLPLMREIKRQFDPGRLLNPGRLAGRL